MALHLRDEVPRQEDVLSWALGQFGLQGALGALGGLAGADALDELRRGEPGEVHGGG